MTTKYILHGGFPGAKNWDNDTFFSEFTKGLKGDVKVLLNYFARDPTEFEKSSKQDMERIQLCNSGKKLQFKVASEEDLEGQIKWADVLYMRGGLKTASLMERMNRLKDTRSLFDGKVVAGSSSGAYAVARYYFENDADEIGRGLGLLDIKCYCHADLEHIGEISRLMEYEENLPLILLPNYKVQILYK